MTDEREIPFLLQLADDPSDSVRSAIGAALSGFGNELDLLLVALDPPADHVQRQRARTLVQDYRRDWLREHWASWYGIPAPRTQLEAAFALITAFQDGPHVEPRVAQLLDELAGQFFNTLGEHTPITLARYLFQTRGLRGAEPDYYLPQNSNLRHVIEAGRGIPISLAAIYVLVGHRLGYEVTACNWPNHFLATAMHDEQHVIVDCFRGGQCIEVDRFLSLQGPSRDAANAIVEEDTPPATIMARVLKNLVRQYQAVEHFPNAQLMLELLQDLERHHDTRTPR